MSQTKWPKRPLLATIFISPNEPRLRAGWRLLIQTILIFILGFCMVWPLIFLGNLLASSTGLLTEEIFECLVLGGSIFLTRRFLDKRSFISLGFKPNKWAVYDVLAGIPITFFMMGLIYLFELSVGWLTFESFAWQVQSAGVVIANILLFLAIFALTGWNEELLSRGYHLQTIASGLNLFWGVVLSSAIFGLLHAGNPSANWISTAGIFLAGLFLAYGYLRTGQLWLSIGLHLGWNFFEGVIFGFPVSGLDVYRLTRITVSGPELWTGGVFGPEAGLVVLPALGLGAVLIFIYTKFLRKPA